MPWCNAEGELELFHLESMDELEVGMYRILEPKLNCDCLNKKQVPVEQLDLIMVPGVGLMYAVGAWGMGRATTTSFSNMLARTHHDCSGVECQIFEEIPVAPHDVFMDKIITEDRIIAGRGR